MEKDIKVLMEIIRAEVCAETPDVSEFLLLPEEKQMELAKLAKHHCIAQLLGDALGRNPASALLPVTEDLLKNTMLALNQVIKNDKTRKEICRFLDEMGILYIPLKGARIRSYYPQPWMRSSCDIDILVHRDQAERTAELICEKLGFRKGQRGFHDISLFSPSNVHLELHFSLLEEMEQMDRVLDRVWEYSTRVSQERMEYVQSNEFFVFHLVAHMVRHMVTGGCGIRPFIDLFLLKKQMKFDEKITQQLCREAGILTFYHNVWDLVNVWFEGEEHTQVTERMEAFIVSGGSYGTVQNHIAVDQSKEGGKLGYIRSRLWAPTATLTVRYPILKSRPWLMPIYQVRRWCSIFDPNRSARIQNEFSIVYNVNCSQKSDVERMLKDNGLL